jgi:hypothetical protein
MRNPLILPRAMKLYAPFCPEGRLYHQGEEWPGDAWSANPDGKDAEVGAVLSDVQKALDASKQEVERLTRVIASKDHDLAVMGRERDEAVAEMKAQKQSLLDAQLEAKEAGAAARDLTRERDAARQDQEVRRRGRPPTQQAAA